jgi:large-conductance mechanosensitive channel
MCPGSHAPLGQGRRGCTFNLGVFIKIIISFIIRAFAAFLVIKGINRMNREKEAMTRHLSRSQKPSISRKYQSFLARKTSCRSRR